MKALPTAFNWVSQLNNKGIEKLLLFCLAAKADCYGRVHVSLCELANECELSGLKTKQLIHKLNECKIIYAKPEQNFYYLRLNVPASYLSNTEMEV